MSLLIREATEADLDDVLTLYLQSGLDSRVLEPEQARAVFRRFADYPSYRLFVAWPRRGGLVVGC